MSVNPDLLCPGCQHEARLHGYFGYSRCRFGGSPPRAASQQEPENLACRCRRFGARLPMPKVQVPGATEVRQRLGKVIIGPYQVAYRGSFYAETCPWLVSAPGEEEGDDRLALDEFELYRPAVAYATRLYRTLLKEHKVIATEAGAIAYELERAAGKRHVG